MGKTALIVLLCVALTWLVGWLLTTGTGWLLSQTFNADHRYTAANASPQLLMALGAGTALVTALSLIVSGLLSAALYSERAAGTETRRERFGFLCVMGAAYWLSTGIVHLTHPAYGTSHLKWFIGLPVTLTFVCAGGLLSVLFDKRERDTV